ncbi:hypothetical protein KC19_5G085900, partial [Ceratodon purpureus]
IFSTINSAPGHLTKTLQTNAKTLHIPLRLENESSPRIILTLSLKHHPNTPNDTLDTRLNHQSSNSHHQLPNSKNHPNSTQLNSHPNKQNHPEINPTPPIHHPTVLENPQRKPQCSPPIAQPRKLTSS